MVEGGGGRVEHVGGAGALEIGHEPVPVGGLGHGLARLASPRPVRVAGDVAGEAGLGEDDEARGRSRAAQARLVVEGRRPPPDEETAAREALVGLEPLRDGAVDGVRLAVDARAAEIEPGVRRGERGGQSEGQGEEEAAGPSQGTLAPVGHGRSGAEGEGEDRRHEVVGKEAEARQGAQQPQRQQAVNQAPLVIVQPGPAGFPCPP